MILDIISGDILGASNKSDVIIGMNTELNEVFGIGLNFTWRIKHKEPIPLGTVYSFKLNDDQRLHMIICHELGEDGWKNAEQYIRFGMDYLWHTEDTTRTFSIVKIGTGRVGRRDGACVPDIMEAIASSHLPVTVYIHDAPLEAEAVESLAVVPPTLVAYRSWSFHEGEVPMAA